MATCRYSVTRQPYDLPPTDPGCVPWNANSGEVALSERELHPGRALLGLLVVLLLLAIGCWYYEDLAIHRVDALPGYPGRPAPSAGTNWLLVGSPDRTGLDPADRATLGLTGPGGGSTDAILLLNIPDGADPATLISLPRDSYLPIPGHGTGRLGSVPALGGPALLTRTVERATGLRIAHYAQLGYAGLANVVDDVGGVRPCPGACATLDGAATVRWLRAAGSPPRDDPARLARQRQFLGAVFTRITGPGVYLDPFRLFPLLVDLPDALTVDRATRPDDLLDLALTLRGLGTGGVHAAAVPLSTAPGPGGSVIWDPNRTALLFGSLRSGRPLPAAAL